MSRRRGDGRSTPLDRAFQERGLVRVSDAAVIIGCDPTLLEKHIKVREGLGVSFEWRPGHWHTGIPRTEVDVIAARFRRAHDGGPLAPDVAT